MRWIVPLFLFSMAANAAAPETFVGCRQISDDTARLQCYDQAADALLQALHGVAEPAPAAAETAQATPPPTAATQPPPEPAKQVTPDSLFGKEKVATDQVVKQVLGVEVTSSITSTIKNVARTPVGKLQVQLANGQAWAQIDDVKLTLHDGDAVVIRAASFGSYLLEKASGSRTIRVKRID